MIKSDKNKGIIFIIISAFCFALMNAFVHLAGDLPTFQKVFFRNAIAMLFAFFILIRNKGSFRPSKKGNLKYLVLRALFGTVGMFCNFYAVDKLVLSDASILNKMSPFFALIFSVFILKEKVKPLQWCAVFLAFVGCMFIVKPSFSNTEFIPSLIGFIGGMGAGLAYTFVRKLGQRGENSVYIVFFFSAFSSVISLPLAISVYQPMSWYQTAMLVLAGLSAMGGQFTITRAYTCAPAREISVYDYSQIIFAAGLGFILFGQLPDMYSFIGYAVIILMALLTFLYSNRLFVFRHNNSKSE